MKIYRIVVLAMLGLFLSYNTHASETRPSIAVTDLAYTSEVSEHVEVARIKGKTTVEVKPHVLTASQKTEALVVSTDYKKIEQKELPGFTNDIKGKLLQGKLFQLIQTKQFDSGKPVPTKTEQVLAQIKSGNMVAPRNQPEVQDIVARIKKGEFNRANFVLFGTLVNIDFRDQLSPIQGTTNTALNVSLDLQANFSLIDTKTFEIFSSFSASGSASETKILSQRGDVVVPNRGKLIRETSQSLASNVYDQLSEQFVQPRDSELAKKTSYKSPDLINANGMPMEKNQDHGITRIR